MQKLGFEKESVRGKVNWVRGRVKKNKAFWPQGKIKKNNPTAPE